MCNGEKPIILEKSTEEAVDLIKAILGFKPIISNVNMPNYGQMKGIREGAIVETNCIFTSDTVKPVIASPLPSDVLNLVERASLNIDSTYYGIKERNLQKIFNAFANQALCNGISRDKLRNLFIEMVLNTKEYLKDYYDLSKLENIK